MENMQIYSDLENLIIKNQDSLEEFMYVGGYKTGPGKPWTWQDRGILNYNVKWAENEPNNPNEELCLSTKNYQGNVGMNDIWCKGDSYFFFCTDIEDYTLFFNGATKI